ncbi:filamentous hemagglutinin [Variovorax paradoxus]|uniref:two-partner secretion domain-containing protein n=1 Tax=Variovorax paradoxus TaxID=34073 RepID=UPI00277D942F|nr:hemagglutinin repeat-containing protein [Variovorax paradoxus]MDQ0027816.1 filamentous hemagglutinin [Variovorax paradoxus]
MNRHLHRIIFNAARGMRMVVQETASSTGKGKSKTTGRPGGAGAAVKAVALLGALVALPGEAQIVGAPNVPANLRPTVMVAPNGVPLLNIQTPSAAGVSRNVYQQFNVAPNGAILNNSRTNVQSQLGGFVQGNPYLATGPARIILNEVNGGSPSQLRGYIEVAGQRAEVVIANPAGISVDGGGFINASRATLTTGTPQFNAIGGLDSFLVRGGTITIDGAGLDASKTDYAAILARAVEANAGIWASELKVVTGANTVSADHSQVTPTSGTGTAPTFALDVAALGGMYAGKITLIGTEAGLGVRNAGTIQAAPGATALMGAGQLVVTSAGRLENIGTLQATADANLAASALANSGRISSGGNLKLTTQGDLANALNGTGGTLEGARLELASTAGDIDNRGGTIRQTSSAGLALSAPALSNISGGVIGAEPVAAAPSTPEPGTGGGAGTGTGGTTSPTTPTAGTGTETGSGGSVTPAPYVPPSPGAITATGTIRNDGGKIYAGGPISLQSANINNNGGTLNVASMAVSQPTFDNHGGTLTVSNGFSATVDRFDNTGGTLNAGSLNITTTGDLVNVDGKLTSATDATLTVGGQADNTRGTISATGALTANVAGAVNNTGGTLVANQAVALGAGSLDNTQGSIHSAQAGVQLAVADQLQNGSGGTIGAAADLKVQAGSLANANGASLRGSNDVSVAVGGAVTNDGSVTAGRHTTVAAGSLQSGTAGVLGAGIQSDGKLGAAGDLVVTTTGALVANGTNLAAGNATLQGASVDLSASQTSAANIAVTATQGSVTTNAATVTTPGTLSVTANAQPGQTLVNQGGKLSANQLDLHVSNLANTNGGEIVQTGTGATTIATSGAIDNSGATLASNGSLSFTAASLNNQGGTLQAAQVSDLNVDVTGLLDNSQGQISAGDNATLQAGSLVNDAGRITAAGDVASTTSAATSNRGGTIAANGSTALNAGSLDNGGGTVSGLNRLAVNVQGTVDNTSGTLAANQALTLSAGSLANDKGSIQSAQAATQVNVTGALTNGQGYIGAATDLGVQAGSLSNAAGGSLRGANDTTMAVAGLLANDGSITAGRNTTITTGSLQGGSTGVLGAGVQSDGKLGMAGELSVTASGALAAHGTHLAAGNVALQGASVDVSAGQTSAANIAITATQGDVITSQAMVVTPGTLSVTANSKAPQTLVNDAGQLNAKQLDLKLSNLANTNGGEIVQTGTGATTIATTGTLNNNGGRIASNGQDLSLGGASITNAGGKIEHAGVGTLNIAGGSYNGANGQVTANGALTVAMSGAFNQDGATAAVGAKRITIDAGSLGNRAGAQIVQTGADATRITVVGALDNSGGTLASNGNTTVAAGSLSNQGGILRAAETSDLGLTVGGLLDNSNKGVIGAGGTTAIAAGSLNNSAGSVTAAEDLTVTVGGAATNVGGSLAANGNTTLVAGTLDNSSGTAAAVNGNLSVTTTGATTNNGGTLQAGAATTLLNSGLSNVEGKVFGSTLSVNTRANGQSNALNNTQGTLAAATTVAVNSGALINAAGLIQSGGAMTIDTNGQLLTNTNAAGYINSQGGISSGGTLNLTTGSVNNNAGFIGAKNAVTASTQGFSNTGGGLVLGQSTVAINTNGAGYDNTGGRTLAAGDLAVNAGTLTNTSGLIRSAATTTLNAGRIVNTSTLGTEQGIEGLNVAVGAGNLDNSSGAIRADVNATITSGGTVNNTNGLISAGDTLAIADPNAANPGAKTLNLVNTGGTLVADKSLKIDVATFSGDGRAISGQDLSIALQQDIVNNGEVTANGNLSYTTTGNFTNNGKLLAGQTLTVGGNNVDNTANAEMSGTNTIVNAGGTLTNRGLIDSRGATQINAGTLKNIGTGRIYGNDISIGAGTLENDAETVNGAIKAATIAARNTLNIGAGTINNREHSLVFSGGLGTGSMNIGGALDANRKAIGQGAVLNNLSADIESLGDMSISMGQVNNRDVHIHKGAPTVTPSTLTGIAPITLVGSGVGRTTTYPLDEVNVDAVNGFVYLKATGELVGIGGYAVWHNSITTTEDTAINIDPAHLVAGGDMKVNGRLYNENSQVLAGGTITATDYQSYQLTGTRTVTGSAIVIDNKGQVQAPNVPLILPPQTISLGAYKYQENINAAAGYNAGVAPVGSGAGGAAGKGAVGGGQGPATIVEVPANVGDTVKVDVQSAGSATGSTGPDGTTATQSGTGATDVGVSGAATGTASSAQAGASRTVPMVVRTSMPNARIPNASLFNLRAGSGSYLIETDPRFANYRNWLSSDYLLNSLGQDPNNTLKRLGDGFYEQKLIREQVAQLTGYRYLDGFDSDEDQYTALMNAGVTFAKQVGLRPGIALTAAQMAQLTSDIVWLVEQTVTLPDGTTQRVLVPQVYVRVRPGDIDGSGALLSADATIIKSSGDVTNTGTIAGRSLVKINAENVNNLGGRIAGGSIGINARNDLNNIGGSITARDAAVLTAGRDINVRTTTQTAGANTAIDRIAGVYVTNPGGVLIASAGRDTNLVGAALVSAGSASVAAGRNINLDTVKESYTIVAVGNGGAGISSASREVGSVIQGQDTVRLAAGNDINIRAGAVASVDGALIATAKNDINLTAGQATTSVTTATQKSSNGLFKKSSSSTFDNTTTTDVLSSSLSGKSVAVVAGNDINLQAAQLRSDEAMSLSAGRDINLTTATSSSTELHASQQRTSSTGLSRAWALASDAGGPVGGYGNRKNSGNSASADFKTQAVGTTISAGSLQTVSGRDTTLQAATVVADGNITMMAGRNLTIESAQNTELSSSSSANAKSGFIGSWSAPGLGHIKDFGAQTTSRTTQQVSQVASLTGNVTLVAGNEYRQTASSVMAAGQAGPLAGGDVNILAKNVTINEAYNTEQSMTVQRSSSSKLGGSASFMGISTDSLRNAQSTVRAMGDTSDNGRMQALGAINLAMASQQAYGAGSTLAGALSGSGPSLSSMSEAGTLSYGVSVTASRNTSQGTSFSTSSTAVGSSITGANNVNIVATGAGQNSNIHAVGSTIAAGNTVNLAADNDITLEASKNASVGVGQNSSHGTSVGVTFGAGAQNGFSIQLGVQNGKGRDNQNATTYNATQVSGGNAVNVSSGRNLTLNGATIEGNRVTVDVGGDLNIATLQDVNVGQSRQSSGGFGVSLCIPPICYGAVATVSANAASAKANGVFISPNTQSGIKARDGGFDVNVKGNTNLTGAVIESTQAAIDNNKNSFATGGALTMSDLQNVSQSSGSSYSVSGSASVGQTTNPNATPQQRTTQNQLSQPGIKPGGAGVGSYSGTSQSSTTRSGISGVAGDQSVRTGNTASAGTLVRDWNTQTILQNVQAQAQITQQFGPAATGFWAGIADEQLRDAQAREDQEAIKCWSANGMCRAAGHAVIGGLTGGAAGATGAVLSTQIAPLVNQIAEDYGLSETSRTLVVAGLTTAVGAAVGGAAVAAGAFNEVTNNFLTGRQVAQKEKELADCQKVGNCKAVVDKWDRIDLEQQDLLDKLHRAELAVLKNPSEENTKGLSDAKKVWADLYDKFRSEGDVGGMKFVKDVYFTANLNYQLACSKTSSCVPPTRSEIMTGLAMNIDIALATDGALAGVARSVTRNLSGAMEDAAAGRQTAIDRNTARIDNNANRDAGLVQTPASREQVNALVSEHSQQIKTGGIPLSDAAAESIIARVNPPGTTVTVHGQNAPGPDITIRNAANAADVTTVQVKSVANAKGFEKNVRVDLEKPIGSDGGSEIIAVQVPKGANVAQLEGKLRNNFGNYDFTNRNIMVVDELGKVLIPLQPMSNFRKAP